MATTLKLLLTRPEIGIQKTKGKNKFKLSYDI